MSMTISIQHKRFVTLKDMFAYSTQVVRKVTDLEGDLKAGGAHKWFYAQRELSEADAERLKGHLMRQMTICADTASELGSGKATGKGALRGVKRVLALLYCLKHIPISSMETEGGSRDWWNSKGPRFRLKAPWRVRKVLMEQARLRSSFSVK